MSCMCDPGCDVIHRVLQVDPRFPGNGRLSRARTCRSLRMTGRRYRTHSAAVNAVCRSTARVAAHATRPSNKCDQRQCKYVFFHTVSHAISECPDIDAAMQHAFALGLQLLLRTEHASSSKKTLRMRATRKKNGPGDAGAMCRRSLTSTCDAAAEAAACGSLTARSCPSG